MFGTEEQPMPDRVEVDEVTGEQKETADFMPRLFDNIPVQRSVLEDWMKTEEFESLDQAMQATANEIYLAMLRLEADKAAREQMAMEAAAQQKGAQNAAGNFGGQPDAPSPTPGSEDNLQTPNQPANQNVPER